MKRLKRHRVTFPYPEVPVLYPMCDGEEVAELEAKCAELESKCAELETKCAELLEAATNVVEWWGSGAEINLSAYTLIACLRNAITKAKENSHE